MLAGLEIYTVSRAKKAQSSPLTCYSAHAARPVFAGL